MAYSRLTGTKGACVFKLFRKGFSGKSGDVGISPGGGASAY